MDETCFACGKTFVGRAMLVPFLRGPYAFIHDGIASVKGGAIGHIRVCNDECREIAHDRLKHAFDRVSHGELSG